MIVDDFIFPAMLPKSNIGHGISTKLTPTFCQNRHISSSEPPCKKTGILDYAGPLA
jgi:hypothetical protein